MATMSLLKKDGEFKDAILGRLKEAMDSFGDRREDEQQARWDTDKFLPMLVT
jgi:hypothetical protein